MRKLRFLKKFLLTRIPTNQKPNFHELSTRNIRVNSIKIRVYSCLLFSPVFYGFLRTKFRLDFGLDCPGPLARGGIFLI